MSKMDPVMGYDPTLESWEGEDPGEAIIPEKPLEEKTADSVIDAAMDHYLDEKDGQVDTFANETNEAGFDPILGMEDLKSLEREINVGIEQLDYLLDLQERLKLAKGINRSLGLEAIERVPDFKFQSDRFFTTHTSTVNYQPSMESIGSKIKEFIAKLWEKIVAMFSWFSKASSSGGKDAGKKTSEKTKLVVKKMETVEKFVSNYYNEPMAPDIPNMIELIRRAAKPEYLTKVLESDTVGFDNWCQVNVDRVETRSYVNHMVMDVNALAQHLPSMVSTLLNNLRTIHKAVTSGTKSIELETEVTIAELNENTMGFRSSKAGYEEARQKDRSAFKQNPLTLEGLLVDFSGVSREAKQSSRKDEALKNLDIMMAAMAKAEQDIKTGTALIKDLLKEDETDPDFKVGMNYLKKTMKTLTDLPPHVRFLHQAILSYYKTLDQYLSSVNGLLLDCVNYIRNHPKVEWSEAALILKDYKFNVN